MAGNLIRNARVSARLTAAELARRAQTARSAVSAYEHGRKSPTLETAERLLDAAGYELVARPRVKFTRSTTPHGRPLVVPDRLPKLDSRPALRRTRLPHHLAWSSPDREYDLSDRKDRARVYRTVLIEGNDDDILEFVDGALLADLWDELDLPVATKSAWQPLIDEARSGRDA